MQTHTIAACPHNGESIAGVVCNGHHELRSGQHDEDYTLFRVQHPHDYIARNIKHRILDESSERM